MALLLLTISLSGFAQKTYKYTTVPNDPLKCRIYELDNGLKVYLTDYKDSPRIQTYIAVASGSKNDPPETTGLAHYLEHMMFKGTDIVGSSDWPKEEALINKITQLYEDQKAEKDPAKKKEIYLEIDKVSTEASKYVLAQEYEKMIYTIGGTGLNAWTSTEETVYTVEIPSNEIEKWLELEGERFSKLVLRTFHTELEAVFEEFNRGQDNDAWKPMDSIDAALYRNHTYGTQSTIGTGEHLKNPSLVAINNFFDNHYVPNNMAIILSGDLDMDKTIALIDKNFGSLKRKKKPAFTFKPEEPITSPIEMEVFGPAEEFLIMGYRFGGIHSKDALMLGLIQRILNNGQAGLMDLNLMQKQKVLGAGAYASIQTDYTTFMLQGYPKEGQKLEEVKDLLLSQIELLKKGEFDDLLIKSIATNIQLDMTQSFESNDNRAYSLLSSFIFGTSWEDEVNSLNNLKKITKDEVMKFANEHFKNNYALCYKRTGEDKTVFKVDKPTITPLDLTNEAKSNYTKAFEAKKSEPLAPVFIDFKKEIQNFTLTNGVHGDYLHNKENGLFEIYYILDMGSDNDKVLAFAVSYLDYLGTDKYTPEQLQEEFYKRGLSFNVFISRSRTYISLSGLDESLEEGIILFEHILKNVKGDASTLKELKADILKLRNDNKLSKEAIHKGLTNYAKYGSKSPFTNIIPKKELNAITSDELIAKIKGIEGYKHNIFYYGSKSKDKINELLNKHHIIPETLKEYPAKIEFEELSTTSNQVFVANYKMVQAEVIFSSKSLDLDLSLKPIITLYNSYYGDLVYKDIRESKGLAYSTYSYYSSPSFKGKAHYISSYVGSQADKLKEAITAMNELMNTFYVSESQFDNSKTSVLKQLESDRITKSSVYWSYLSAKQLGIDYDIRENIFKSVSSFTIEDVNKFHDANIAAKKYNYCIIGNRKKLDMEFLKTLGEVKELSLKEIFSY
ncbi:MAG: insulinase family protein [Flavobacteriales bacterium]|nr:insulinase family protein [Flavobacteriales bacterium]